MHILIEDAESFEFLNNHGQWTKNVSEGKQFASAHIAYDTAKKEPIHKFNIVRYFAGTKQFVNMDHGSGKGKASA